MLAALVRERGRSLAEQWAANLGLGGDCGGNGLVRAEFTERYLPGVLRILAHALEHPSPEIIAIYRDELQRYPLQLGHPCGAGTGNALGFEVRDLLTAQRAAIAGCASPGPVMDALDRLHEPLLSPPPSRVDMLLLGDCLMNEVRCFLAEDLRQQGIDLRGYHQYFSGALSAHFDLAGARAFCEHHPVDLIGFSPFTFDALPMYRQLLMEASGGIPPRSAFDRLLDVVDYAIRGIRSWSDAPILLHNSCGAPTEPQRSELTSLPPLTQARLSAIQALNAALLERVAGQPRVVMIDEASIVARAGLREVSGAAVTGLDGSDFLNHTSRLGREIARSYAEVVVAAKAAGRLRALAVDFDGTLWHGVMAEGTVLHYRDRQALLRRAARQGITLIGLSRGAPGTVRWAEMDIAPEDFVIVERTWRPKPVALAEVLRAMGIRPGHVGVIDDDASERGALASAFPDLTLLDANDPGAWRSLTLAADLRTVTSDGARRTERYRTALHRRTFLSELDGQQITASAMAALELRLTCWSMRPADVARTAELLQRTNQFNTSGVTFSEQALARMAGPGAERLVRVASLRDRFGDFGLIAAVVMQRESRLIEAFVLSCRAMGYGVEHVLLDRLIKECGTPVEAQLIRTRLNEPCHGVYAQAGFREHAPGRWRLDQYADAPVPGFVIVETPETNERGPDVGRDD
jgi:FkbH-like protein